MTARITLPCLAALALALNATPAAGQYRAGGDFGDPAVASITPADRKAEEGGFVTLPPASRKIALALFDAQGGAMGNDVAWTLEDIAAAKRSGVAWSKLFERMRAEGLIRETTLGAVIKGAVRKWNARAPRDADDNRAPAARLGAYKTLAGADRRIAEALFETQSIGPAGKQAWSLDQIATARQNGARWTEVLKRMRADGLIRARTLDRVIGRRDRIGDAARSLRKVVIINGKGRRVVLTTRSRRRH